MIGNPESERSRALLARLASGGVTEWQPRGSFDPVTGVWVVDLVMANALDIDFCQWDRFHH